MPYKRQYFKDGQVLMGVHLNHVEEGIVTLEGNLTKADEEIKDKMTKIEDNSVPVNQGEENEGKPLVIDSAGKVAPGEIPSISNADIDDIVEGEEEEPEVEEASEDGEIDS